MAVTFAVSTVLSPNPASGNTTTDGTAQSLASATAAPGLYLFRLDRSNMADGDAILVTVLSKVSGGTRAVVWQRSCQDAQSEKIWETDAIATDGDIEFQLKRLAGTDRAYRWDVLQA